jgi:iron complex transport system ATP-binding protein
MTTMSARTELLHVDKFSAGYRGRPVVDQLTLSPIPAGTVTALVGPNGAGKSTLLRAMAGLLPARGSVRFAGSELGGLSFAARAKVATYMPQMLPAGAALSVLETVIGALKASDTALQVAGADVPVRAMAALERLGIGHLALEPLDRLSGGQRQMAGLAQVVVRDTALLLLDEPTSALDLRHQVEVMAVIRSLADEGRTVIVVLHDLTLAARWADLLVVLDRGRVHAEGAPAAVVTEAMLAAVYGVAARVEHCSRDFLHVAVDGPRTI